MRIVVSIMALLFFSSPIFGQVTSAMDSESSRRSIPPIEKERLTESSYKEQSVAWENETQINPADENAWLNYYKAERYTNFSAHSRGISRESQFALDDILSNMEQHVPNSLSFHYASFLNGNYSDAALKHLEMAFNLQPNNKELFDEMLSRAVIQRDTEKQKLFAGKLKTTGVYTPAELEYNHNLLSGIPSGGVLITYGNVDTYPILIDQLVQSYRGDVTVVCLNWIGSERYRGNLAAQLGIPAGQLKPEEETFVKTLVSQLEKKRVFLSLTLPPSLLKKYSTELYLEGLAFEYSPNKLDNLPLLAGNWEVYYKKNELLSSDPLNRNYILPLTELYNYYRDTGQPIKQKECEVLLRQLAGRTSSPAKVTKYLD